MKGKLKMETSGKIAIPAWMVSLETLTLMDALLEKDLDAMFVGGCVRDSLINKKVYDIDIATILKPEEVMARLGSKNIKTIPTGLQHGTVTAVVDGTAFEITTLRKDSNQDGRHAEIEYTNSWQEDALRRDFTMNAIFCSMEGDLYDFFGGLEDLRLGKVKFVGNAEQRIEEDYLRILRYFRFYAHYGNGEMDLDALKYCIKHADKIQSLSIERIKQEIMKLLLATRAADIWQILVDEDIVQYIYPNAKDIASLKRLVKLESKYDSQNFQLRKLAVLMTDKTLPKFAFSNDEKQILQEMVDNFEIIDFKMTEQDIRRIIYQFNNDTVRNLLLLKAAKYGEDDNFESLYRYATSYRIEKFGLQGIDVLKHGIESGPKVGEALRYVENWWINQDFKPNRKSCLEKLAEFLEA